MTEIYEERPFKEWKDLKEILIRGMFTTLSADLEYFIIKIIVYCDAKNPKLTEQLKKKTLTEKIGTSIYNLRTHYNSKFLQYKDDLNDLINNIVPIRNHIAHCQLFFDENEIDRSFIRIRDLKFINGEHTFEEITYEIEGLTETMNKLRKINIKLHNLWAEILEDYKLHNSKSSLP